MSLSLQDEPVDEQTDEQVEEKLEEEFTEEAVLKLWSEYLESKKGQLTEIEAMVLRNKPRLLEGHKLELTIKNGVEIKILKKMEEDLLSFLRLELKNRSISLVHKEEEEIEGENLYTDAEKFNDMAKRHPILLELKERLGLDTDY